MKSGSLSGLVAFGVAFMLAMGSAPAAAQQVDIAAAQKRFQDLHAAGDYAAALAEAQKTEAAAKRGEPRQELNVESCFAPVLGWILRW